MTSIAVGTTGAGEIFKVDARGRVRVEAERKEILLDEFERGGMSGREFAKYVGVAYQTFAAWRLKRRKKRGEVVKKSPVKKPAVAGKWLEAVVAVPKVGGALKVQLPGGSVLSIEDASQASVAAALILALEASRSC